ncbi:Beta-hexosaminidase 1 [Morella rubra]|uniref:Beta-hexosaminidase n=1 Tax=Morella rubra TaxID=262757 RepID=A0A6A1VYU7_9ROSI|nr:Beta-hexosaminidase 1 [Morella rubra]
MSVYPFKSIFLIVALALYVSETLGLSSPPEINGNLTYLWPLPSEFTHGNDTLSVDPGLLLAVGGIGGNSEILRAAFDRYRGIVFKHSDGLSIFSRLRGRRPAYDINKLKVIVHSDNEEAVYTLLQSMQEMTESRVIGVMATKLRTFGIIFTLLFIYVLCRNQLANTVYGALRGLETFSQLCAFDYGAKSVQVYKAPWYIRDKPRFAYRGLLLDTSRHFLPIDVIKQIIESMSYAKLSCHRLTVCFLFMFPHIDLKLCQSVNVMAEVDIPGHAESWGTGYPDLWPSPSCREPLDVTKNFTFDVVSGILTDMRKIFPFELFHLGGDEVNTGCWSSTPHVKQWLQSRNMTTKEAYQYFVLKAQEIAISKNWTPVNWEETFNAFAGNLNPRTVVHNWLGGGVCPKAVAKGFRCIFSNQGVWYLDHLDVPWDKFYTAEPVEGINDASKQELVLGGEVCMWGETADTSNVQQTIWPRAAAAAERLWTSREAISTGNITLTALPRLLYFRCLLNRRGVQAAPVTNSYARSPPSGPGSCYEQ